MSDDLRYPIGPYERPAEPVIASQRQGWIDRIAATPRRMREAVAGLSDEQLDTPYRPGGWTVRQVVHHVPDSHLNAYIRVKWVLTEDGPTIKTYDQDRWAELPDSRDTPVAVSLALLERLHERWLVLLRSLTEEQCRRRFHHPELGEMTLDELIALYAWHGDHHVAHIDELKRRRGWS